MLLVRGWVWRLGELKVRRVENAHPRPRHGSRICVTWMVLSLVLVRGWVWLPDEPSATCVENPRPHPRLGHRVRVMWVVLSLVNCAVLSLPPCRVPRVSIESRERYESRSFRGGKR